MTNSVSHLEHFTLWKILHLEIFYSIWDYLEHCLKMPKTSREAGGYAQIFIFDQKLSAIRSLKMPKTSREAGGYAQFFIFD
jgi:hypothetical protein